MKNVILGIIIIICLMHVLNSEADTLSLQKAAVELLKKEEGFRAKPYIGPEGYLHIGYGQKLSNEKGEDPDLWHGHVSKEIAENFLVNKVSVIDYQLYTSPHKSIYKQLTDERKVILISMVYQMGYEGVLDFKNMWRYLYLEDYTRAAFAMLNSKWYRQTPERATRHAKVMVGDTNE